MRNINNNHVYSYRNQPYFDRELRENNIVNFSELSKKTEVKCFSNEIFCCIAIATLLVISFGGNHLIQNRTRQHLIYNSVLETSTNSDY